MATGVISKNINSMVLKKIDATIPANAQRIVDLTATIPTGYSFLCWVSSAASGWIGQVWFSDPDLQTTNVWTTATSTSARNVRCYYLVYN